MADETPAYCPRCGAEAGRGQYCPDCGADLAAEAQPAGGGEHASAGSGQQPAAGPEQPTAGPEQQPATPSAENTSDGPDWGSMMVKAAVVVAFLLAAAMAAGVLLDIGGGGDGGFGGEPEHQVHDGWDTERTEATTYVRVTGTVTLPEGRYAARGLNPEVGASYSIEIDVVEGGPVDVYVLPEDEYDRYRDRSEDIQFYAELSEAETTGTTLSGELSSGDYRLVIDNTAVYGASAGGEAEVEVDMTAGL